jgi:hypothetical protein
LADNQSLQRTTSSSISSNWQNVMTFLGRKLNGNFQGDLVTHQLVDFSQLPRRLPGRRVKHRMKRNWIKMYNKEGSVLRVETLITSPCPAAAPWRLRSSYVRSLTRALYADAA